MAKKAAPPTPTEVVWEGSAQLRPLLELVADLFPDLTNINEHDERSYTEIAGSYQRFGQQKPVVCDAEGVVRAGNGQLEAAKRLGWTHLAVVRSDLAESELALFAIADNQTPRHSGFNFMTEADVEAFAKLVGQNITDRTKFIWYPKQEELPRGELSTD